MWVGPWKLVACRTCCTTVHSWTFPTMYNHISNAPFSHWTTSKVLSSITHKKEALNLAPKTTRAVQSLFQSSSFLKLHHIKKQGRHNPKLQQGEKSRNPSKQEQVPTGQYFKGWGGVNNHNKGDDSTTKLITIHNVLNQLSFFSVHKLPTITLNRDTNPFKYSTDKMCYF